jgi:uncharacterized metal-binding protein YceD (DUF177 family)
MPEIANRSPDNPEFARVVELARLRGRSEFAFELSPTAEEAQALARLFDAQGLRKMRLKGRLRSTRGGWELTGALGATVIQSCVVTLAPVTTRLDLEVRRLFLPEAAPQGREIEVALEDEEIEPLGTRIDLGLVAIEAIALALPAYPRSPGAELEQASFAAPGIEPIEEAEVKPFASLAALRDKLGNRH